MARLPPAVEHRRTSAVDRVTARLTPKSPLASNTRPALTRGWALVQNVFAGPPPTVDLFMDGGTIPSVSCLASYQPAAGDTVIVDFLGGNPIVIGPAARAAPAGRVLQGWSYDTNPVGSTASTSSTTWIGWYEPLNSITNPFVGTALGQPIVKLRGDTAMRCSVSFSGWMAGTAAAAEHGISFDGVTYFVDARFYFNTVGDHQTVVGKAIVTGIAAGSYTPHSAMRVTNAAGTFNVDFNDSFHYLIEEVLL
ncbi:MAG: hypothetical protein ACRDXE_11260 [Acidimicrobiales bacterium]